MEIHTPLCDLLGIRTPILNGAMTPQAGGALAASVTAAGGFGMLGLAENESTESLREQIALARAGAGTRFGIGLVHWMVERRPELFDLALEAEPALVCVSFGDLAPYAGRLHERGILAAAQVQSTALAQRALDAGVDIVIAQGTEAGGHTGAVGTLPLLQIILAMTERPVLAAGGIATGRGVAAVIAAGAAGAWIGTPFLLAAESRSNPKAQDAIVASDETATIRTSVYDRLQRTGWTSEFAGRALRNPFAERWSGREEELVASPDAVREYERAKSEGDYSIAQIYAGQSVGMLNEVRPARDILADLSAGAAAALWSAARNLRE